MTKDENSLNTHVNPSRQEVGEGDTPIFYTFFDVRLENKPMDTILDAMVTFVILTIVLVGHLRVETKEWR